MCGGVILSAAKDLRTTVEQPAEIPRSARNDTSHQRAREVTLSYYDQALPVGLGIQRMRVRQIESLAELAAAWRLVAEVLQQDDTHPRNFAFYARHLPHHPELLLVALAPDEESPATTPQPPGSAEALSAAAAGAPQSIYGALLAHAEPDYVWIGKLAVAADYRRRGAGSALLSLVEQNAV